MREVRPGRGENTIGKALLQCSNIRPLGLCEMVTKMEGGTSGPNSPLSLTRLNREAVSASLQALRKLRW